MTQLNTWVEEIKKHNLLKEIIFHNQWHMNVPVDNGLEEIQHITYDSRDIKENTLFFCKGANFHLSYLEQAIKDGATCYISETPYEVDENVLGIIVTDVKKAMAVVSQLFYNHPEKELKIVAYTGTKGKTTSTYLCYEILKRETQGHVAFFSTLETNLGAGETFKSKLTTPESLDLYRMMRQAVTNGMTHLVMEVSSQAYKLERVYNLTFDVGVFLNISPDHISDIEHPTFDDYFYCKRQLLANSRQIILNADSDYADFLYEYAKEYTSDIITFGEQADVDVNWQSINAHSFSIDNHSSLPIESTTYQLAMEGYFNHSNATSALIATSLVGAQAASQKEGLAVAQIDGRMKKLMLPNNSPVYIDYAHNYLSLATLVGFVKSEYPEKRVHLVIGSTGDKAQSRRYDFARVISESINKAYLTTDDPGSESALDIAETIKQNVTSSVDMVIELDREKAINMALSEMSEQDVLVIAGKGSDRYQIINGEHIPYLGDQTVVEKWIEKEGLK